MTGINDNEQNNAETGDQYDEIQKLLSGLKTSVDKLTPEDKLSHKKLIQLLAANKLQEDLTAAPTEHKFWNTQPVLKLTETVHQEDSGPIDTNNDIEKVRKIPYGLPEGFEWFDVDIHDEKQLKDLYILLNENYVEDDENLFRFDYKPEFLLWALTPPNYFPEWHVGVRVKSNKKMVGFISGIPSTVTVLDKTIKAAEINFLCVYKSLRSKRLAPVLIKEVTRRVNLCNIWQAVYTAGIVIPSPIAKCRYWHRPLDIKKLVNANFSSIGDRMTMTRAIRLYRIPPLLQHQQLRPMQKKDVTGVYTLLKNNLSKYKVHQNFSQQEVTHYFLPRENIIYSYVQSKEGAITDFVSFYSLPSTVIKSPKIGTINAAYAYYNVATSMSFKELMECALYQAKENEFDVFNAVDIMENSEIFEELKFGEGDGELQYYLYNWRFPLIDPKDVGIVLL
ncbi:bifunctional Glycylpeptide N-tetradecanoyltransferase [Babesia duncani]|uniref:Glycylpeptide N-tetradecanoyltransferase n=1 Tax=Babesia duncani TaxID=323732 RepID=A0AAD9PIB1_9APIC|nr:bifunctional Glycylpeptide N-tetradecanoyltransferase [Babesia duncani]